MKCPNCQMENRERAKFCSECGENLEITCPQCGKVTRLASKFCDECGYKFERGAKAEKAKPESESERKNVTVLFSDLCGYTALSEKLDPEEVKEITSRLFSRISEIIGKYEGVIEKFIGDAVVALFGAQTAHEDDPVRAIRAAREIHGFIDAQSPEIEGVGADFWRLRLTEAVRKVLAGLTRRGPTVVCIEDLHWADPSSIDLLRTILSDLRYPCLFLCLYRPPFRLFSDYEIRSLKQAYRETELRDLSPSETQDMIESLLKTKHIPSGLETFVSERTEGNPFYLEEVINSLVESVILSPDNGGWKVTRPISDLSIPSTIQGVISARIDRLENKMKRILQEASVIGRAFLYELLKRITEFKKEVDTHITSLERLDLVRARSLYPHLEYIFKHALTQEVVYGGLLKKERREIHRSIGAVIEEVFSDRLPEFYEALAFHFSQGESLHKAVYYLMKSGEKGLNKYALEEAHQSFREAYRLLSTKGDRAREICAQVESDYFLFCISLFGLAQAYWYRGDSKKAMEIGKDLLEFGKRNSHIRSMVCGHWSMGHSHFIRGDFPSAIECYKQAVEISVDPYYSQIPRTLLGYTYVSNRQFDKAEEVVKEVQRFSEKFGAEIIGTAAHGLLGMVLTGTGHLSNGVERLEDVRKTFFEKNRRCLYAASEYTLGRVYFEIAHGTAPKDPWMIARNLGFLAKTVPFASKKAEGYFTRAAEAAKAIGAKSILAQSCLNLGLLHKAKDKKDKARRFLDEAIGLFEQCEADVYLKQAREALASLG